MKYRKLPIAWSVVWGVACLLLVVLWVRSYRVYDFVTHVKPGYIINTVRSNGGTLSFAHFTMPRSPLFARVRLGWSYGTGDASEAPSIFGLQERIIILPYFLLVALSAAAVGVSWLPRLPRQFSLRTLLIAMTLVAFGLGWIVYALGR
jgi:hypothetical protein